MIFDCFNPRILLKIYVGKWDAKGDPVMIAVGLLVGILVATIASQGHLNPCISAMVYMEGKMSGDETIGYIAAQLVGAIIAVQWYNFYQKK